MCACVQLVQCHGSAYECRETVAGTGKQGPLTADFLDDEALADQARLFCPRAAVCGTAQIVYFRWEQALLLDTGDDSDTSAWM